MARATLRAERDQAEDAASRTARKYERRTLKKLTLAPAKR
jgi:hypothetical protein